MTERSPVVFRDVEVEGRIVDVVVRDGRIAAIGASGEVTPGGGEPVDGRGGALLPGLHDHHVHLIATAAAAESIDVTGLDRDAIREQLAAADASTPPGEWLRVVGFHEAHAGSLDRTALDEMVGTRPIRVQHATGAMWVFNSAGGDAAGLADAPGDGVERDGAGATTGRVFGLDDWLFRRLPRDPPDLAALGRRLTRLGITGVTDATPYRALADFDVLRAAVVARDLVQHVVVTGAPDLDVGDLDPLGVGPAKVVVDDRNPPSIDALADQIATAHRRRGTVALHCASRLALVLTVAAFEQVGACAGDRVEHGAVVPPELFVRLRDLGLTVVTQPAFVHARGDRYLADVEPEDVPHLWRCASLREAGIRVGFGSDAPHGPLDPWLAIRSATDRCTRDGRVLGADERVEGSEALARYLAPADDPGGPPRRVEVGAPGDLCLLHAPVGEVLRAPSADAVRATMVAGVFAAP